MTLEFCALLAPLRPRKGFPLLLLLSHPCCSTHPLPSALYYLYGCCSPLPTLTSSSAGCSSAAGSSPAAVSADTQTDRQTQHSMRRKGGGGDVSSDTRTHMRESANSAKVGAAELPDGPNQPPCQSVCTVNAHSICTHALRARWHYYVAFAFEASASQPHWHHAALLQRLSLALLSSQLVSS